MRPTLRRFGGLVLAACLLCTLAGCISESDSDGMTTYTYAWWTAILGAGGAVFSAALGWFLIGSGPDMPLQVNQYSESWVLSGNATVFTSQPVTEYATDPPIPAGHARIHLD